jgi:hypothetical protein
MAWLMQPFVGGHDERVPSAKELNDGIRTYDMEADD